MNKPPKEEALLEILELIDKARSENPTNWFRLKLAADSLQELAARVVNEESGGQMWINESRFWTKPNRNSVQKEINKIMGDANKEIQTLPITYGRLHLKVPEISGIAKWPKLGRGVMNRILFQSN